MWGSDWPRDEGTYPYARDGLRDSYTGPPSEGVAVMSGGNAARVYGFDVAALDPMAARFGPTVKEMCEPLKESPADAASPVFATGGDLRVW